MLIIDEFLDFLWITENDLDSNLWAPYESWKEKIRNLSFEEITPFREKMISTIREVGERIRKNQRDSSSNSVKKEAIERIKKLLKAKGIKIEDLDPNNHNYEEEINRISEPDLDKEIESIMNVEERVSEDIKLKSRKKSGNSENNEENIGWQTDQLRGIINDLEKQQRENPFKENEDRLKEAKEKLKNLEDSPQSSNLKTSYRFSPESLMILGGIILIIVSVGVVFLINRSKKMNKI